MQFKEVTISFIIFKIFYFCLSLGLIDQYTASQVEGMWTENCKPDGKCGGGNRGNHHCQTSSLYINDYRYCGTCELGWRWKWPHYWCCSWSDFTYYKDCKCPASTAGECKSISSKIKLLLKDQIGWLSKAILRIL